MSDSQPETRSVFVSELRGTQSQPVSVGAHRAEKEGYVYAYRSGRLQALCVRAYDNSGVTTSGRDMTTRREERQSTWSRTASVCTNTLSNFPLQTEALATGSLLTLCIAARFIVKKHLIVKSSPLVFLHQEPVVALKSPSVTTGGKRFQGNTELKNIDPSCGLWTAAQINPKPKAALAVLVHKMASGKLDAIRSTIFMASFCSAKAVFPFLFLCEHTGSKSFMSS